MQQADCNDQNQAEEPITIGSQLQLFVDRKVVGSLRGLDLRLHAPVKMPMAATPLTGSYITVIHDVGAELYRAYYRDDAFTRLGKDVNGEPDRIEACCYAESSDGHEWTRPKLGLIPVDGSADNNVILQGGWGTAHNFSPFLDSRQGVDPRERFKALVGGGTGLQAFVSADGIHWKCTWERVRNRRGGSNSTGFVIEPESDGGTAPPSQANFWDAADVLDGNPDSDVSPDRSGSVVQPWFDSQNVSFWSEVEQCYACYFRSRVAIAGVKQPIRTISRTTAKDFLGPWSKPVLMEANFPGENLYTSQTHPYFRAPDIYLAFPTRFLPARGSSTDILFMSTRPGANRYERLFTEALIRPGLDGARWGNRANYLALNVVPTGPDEMSLYHKSGDRYTLRTDGFVSVHAGSGEGEFFTRLLTFVGRGLMINYSTSAAGSVRVELQNREGQPIPGYGLAESVPMTGDAIGQEVQWRSDRCLGSLAGQHVRLRFVMEDGDLYSFQFREG